MVSGITFAEVLDQEMAGFLPSGPVSARKPVPPPPYRLLPPNPLLFSRPLRQFRATTYDSMFSYTVGAAPITRAAVTPPTPPRRPRRLTLRERRAVDELVTLGADLAFDFTDRELRSAYRTLARRYHPDRHPTSNETEKAQLARVFAGLNENHRLLAALADAPTATVRP
jgi:hypothetical protein